MDGDAYTNAFDLDGARTTRASDPYAAFDAHGEPQEGQPANPLDGEQAMLLHRQLLNFYEGEVARQQDNRLSMTIDRDFYDGIQWSEEDRATLIERGQNPMVLNIISQTVNWVTGTEKRGRSDFKVLPRRKTGSKQAEKKTQLLKYLGDVNNTAFHRSRAFEDAVIVGLGWLEDSLSADGEGEVITTRYEDWRNMLHDSASTEMDLSDARYVFRQKWTDLDIATGLFPNRRGLLMASAGETGRFGSSFHAYGDEVSDQPEFDRQMHSGIGPDFRDRQRVKLIEAWFYRMEDIPRFHGGEFHGDIFDPEDPIHAQLVQQGGFAVVSRPGLRMHCAIFTPDGMLWAGRSPYRHNRYPFTPIWGYRRGRDGLPYGMIRNLKDLQEDINKRFSKTLFILSTNKVIVEEDAIPNLGEFMNEVSRPDGIIRVKSGKAAAIKMDVDRELAPAHLQLLQHEIGMVQQVGGVTDELRGQTTNTTSGVAIQARQQQGMMQTSKFFDNLRLATKLQGEKELSLIEQFITEEKQFRITNMRGTPEYIDINTGLPEDDITRTKADFVIGEADWRASIRQAQADQLFEMISKLPAEIGMTFLDLAIEHLDLPNIEEIVTRIRAVNGQRDPDAEEPTPQEVAKAQEQQQMQQLQIQEIMLKLRKLAADAGKSEADTQRILAQAGLLAAQTIGQGASTISTAVAAAKGALAPGVATVTDALLDEVGFVPAPITAAADVAMVRARAEADAAAQMQPPAPQIPQPGPSQPPGLPMENSAP